MRPFRRPLLIIAVVPIVGLASLQAINYHRLNAGGLSDGIDSLVERTRGLQKLARPGYQTQAVAALPSNQKNGSYFRLDEHLDQGQVIAAPTLGSGNDKGVLYGLEFNDHERSGLRFAPKGSIRNGVLGVRVLDARTYFTNDEPITVRQSDIGDIIIRARALEDTRLTLGWSRDYTELNPFENQIDIALKKSDKFQTYVVNARTALTRGLAGTDPVAHIYLAPSRIPGVVVEIDFIRFVSKQSLYLAAVNGTTYDTIGGEGRLALYQLSDQHLSYRVTIPRDGPRFAFGQGILAPDKPVRFSVSVTDGTTTTVVHNATMTSSQQWRDYEIDLARWAGRTVDLGLHSTSDHPKVVALWSSPILRSKPTERFNVLVILEDALRADYLSTYGFTRETSPNKTRLMAERGIVFEYAFSQATKTRPSVPALMTGLYPTATGVWHGGDRLSDRYLTLAEVLRSQGFSTASLIQNGNAGPDNGLHQGFDTVREGRLMGSATEQVLGGQTFEWLERHRNENFFLYLHVIDPHGPYDPPPPFNGWYLTDKGRGSTVKPDPVHHDPEGATEPTDVERRARYAGEIRHNDSLIPGLFETLDQLGLSENTLVVFLADHGEYLGEHGNWEHQPPSMTPVIHVPLMMVYPRRFAEPRRITDNVQLIDVMPTILDLAGIGRSGLLLQGESLVDLIEGRNSAHWQDRVVVAEEPIAMNREKPCECASVIYRNWHVVGSNWRHWQTRVFDFHRDPAEETFLLSFWPDLNVRRLQASASTRLREAGRVIFDSLTADENAATRLDPETLERLRALGYVN